METLRKYDFLPPQKYCIGLGKIIYPEEVTLEKLIKKVLNVVLKVYYIQYIQEDK